MLAPASPITSVDVLNPEIDRERWDTEGAILDIRVRFTDGQQVDVEMLATPHGGLRHEGYVLASALELHFHRSSTVDLRWGTQW